MNVLHEMSNINNLQLLFPIDTVKCHFYHKFGEVSRVCSFVA